MVERSLPTALSSTRQQGRDGALTQFPLGWLTGNSYHWATGFFSEEQGKMVVWGRWGAAGQERQKQTQALSPGSSTTKEGFQPRGLGYYLKMWEEETGN